MAPRTWVCLLLALGCSKAGGAAGAAPSVTAPPVPAASAAPGPASNSASPRSAEEQRTAPSPDSLPPNPTAASPHASASAGASSTPSPAPAPAESIDWKNATPYALDTPELQERARGLLDAVAQDKPELGDPFWFPREPFLPLKDVKGPEKYWAQLHRTYAADIHALHRRRKNWEGVHFESFTVGSKPKWVKAGEEANKIGYFRSFHGKLAYRVGEQRGTLDVHTIITWQGRWYVTHLSKFKK